jgi:hypothetical protein
MNTRRPRLTHGIAFQTRDDTGGGTGTGGTGTPGGTGGTPPKTLAQVLAEHPHLAGELDARTQRIAATEKTQGKNSALLEFAKGLGVEDPNIIAETFRRHQEQQAAQMSDAERAKSEAEKARAEAQQALTEAKQAKLDAIAIKQLSKAGAEAPEVMAAGLTRFGVTLDSDEQAVAAAVEEMKKVMPGSFGPKATGTPAGAGNPGTPPAGTPQGGKTGTDGAGGQAKAQLERLQNRRGKPPIPGM